MIKSAKKSDVRILAELEMLMWEDNTVMNLSKEFEELISNEKQFVLLNMLMVKQ